MQRIQRRQPAAASGGLSTRRESRRRLKRYRSAKLELANQSLRDQFQIDVKFQMILLCVAAAAAFHFEFFLLKNKSYHPTPTTLRCDQRCNPLLVGGGSVCPAKAPFNRTNAPNARVRPMSTNPRRVIRRRYNVHASRPFHHLAPPSADHAAGLARSLSFADCSEATSSGSARSAVHIFANAAPAGSICRLPDRRLIAVHGT